MSTALVKSIEKRMAEFRNRSCSQVYARPRGVPGILVFILTFSLYAETPAQPVTSDRDINVDFNKYKTYAWLAPGDSVLNRPRRDKLYGGTIMYTANNELHGRGLAMDTVRPDAIFVFYTSMEEVTTYSQSATLSVGVGVAGPGYYVSGAGPVAGGKITATTSEDGTLKFSMFDTSTGKMVWSGMTHKSFDLSDDVEKLVIDNTVRIFKKFPKRKSK